MKRNENDIFKPSKRNTIFKSVDVMFGSPFVEFR